MAESDHYLIARHGERSEAIYLRLAGDCHVAALLAMTPPVIASHIVAKQSKVIKWPTFFCRDVSLHKACFAVALAPSWARPRLAQG